jgi:hypothetical protein
MLEESDAIQGLAKAHGERICLDEILRVHAEEPESTGMKPVLELVAKVYCLHALNQDVGVLVSLGLVTPSQVTALSHAQRQAVKQMAPISLGLVKSLGVEDHMIYAPIAHDWKQFNETDNKGNPIIHL